MYSFFILYDRLGSPEDGTPDIECADDVVVFAKEMVNYEELQTLDRVSVASVKIGIQIDINKRKLFFDILGAVPITIHINLSAVPEVLDFKCLIPLLYLIIKRKIKF